MRGVAFASGFVAVLSLLAAVGVAAPPTREETVFDNETFPAPGPSAQCGIPVVNVLDGSIIFTTYFDKSGNIVRTVELAPSFKHTWLNTANGKSVTTAQPFRLATEFNADGSVDVSFSGLVYVIRADGKVVARDTGRMVIHIAADGTETLTHDAGPGDPLFPALCQALA